MEARLSVLRRLGRRRPHAVHHRPRQRASNHGHHHDPRSFRDLLEAIGLWLVALAASMSVFSVLFFPQDPTMRGLLTSLALGAFFGVGIIMATEERQAVTYSTKTLVACAASFAVGAALVEPFREHHPRSPVAAFARGVLRSRRVHGDRRPEAAMTYSPKTLNALAQFWTKQGGVFLGVVGNKRHTVGYHLGRDRIYDGNGPGLGDQDYSVVMARDKAGLTDAASAIDLGKLDGTYQGLREFSNWLVKQCQKGQPGYRDIREIIYSPDGQQGASLLRR